MKLFNVAFATMTALAFGSLAYMVGAGNKILPEHQMASQFSIIKDFARYHDAGSLGFKSVVDNQIKRMNAELKESFSFDATQTSNSLSFTAKFISPDEYACRSSIWWESIALFATEKSQYTSGGNLTVQYKDGVVASYSAVTNDEQAIKAIVGLMCKDDESNVNNIELNNTFVQQHSKLNKS